MNNSTLRPAPSLAPSAEENPDIPPTRIRVLLVDDHPITRQGMRALVNQQLNYEVCGEADSASQAIELVRSLEPDLAVVDISLPQTNGIELTKQLKELAPEMPVLVVSMHDEAFYAERAIRAGAMGYVMKQEAGEKVALALQHLMRGEIYLSPPMKQRMLHRFVNKRGDRTEFAIDTLSNREREVFRLIGNGFSTRQIATQLGLSAKTIDSYREHLKFKLGLDNGADLMRHAIEFVRMET
jgi:DNA-binding NarL/FixJ family response regulator